MKLLLTILFALTVTACGGGSSDAADTVELTAEGIPVADTLWENKSWDELYWQ
jgi:hypothetical protein